MKYQKPNTKSVCIENISDLLQDSGTHAYTDDPQPPGGAMLPRRRSLWEEDEED